MKMKRTTERILSSLLAGILLVSLAACGGSTNEGSAAPDDGTVDVANVSGNLVMGTGGVSGTWYPVGGAVCSAMSGGKMNVTVQSSGGGVENIRTILNGERDFGIAGADVTDYAYKGIGDFEGEDGSKLRVLFRFSSAEAQILARADSNINSIRDTKGHPCGVGAAGSGDELAFRTWLGLLDMSYDDIDESLISIAEQATAFKDRRIDTMFTIASAPTSGMLDVASQAKVKLVPIAGDEAKTITDALEYLYPVTITKDKYSFMDDDVETLAMDCMVVCSADLKDEQAYAVLDNMFSNIETVQTIHNSMSNFTPEFAANDGDFTIPMHNGAVKWFTEHGYL